MLALARRHRVDDRHLALEHAVVEIALGHLVLDLGDAGHHRHQPAHAAHLRHAGELLAQVAQVELALAHPLGGAHRLLAVDRWSRPSRPARRCRPCRGCGRRSRAGSKSSSASMRSPVPISLIGLPVTARIDSAAPPRPSPSTRVSTMPVRPTRSSNERARLTASWPVSAVGDQQHFVRVGGALDLGRLVHHLFVERDAAGGVEQHHVVAAELGRLDRAVGDLHRRLAFDDRQGRHVDLLAEHGELLHRGRTPRVERGHQHLGVAALGAGAWRSWPWWWFCRSPAGRPS